MAVVPLTLTISLCLVFSFVVFFLREQARGHISSAERDSLLPLADEIPRPAHAQTRPDSTEHDESGCRDGRRAPCQGCLRHAD